MSSNIRGWNQQGKNHSLNTSNLRGEINCFEKTGLNGPCPNADLLPLIESKAIEGERKSTYWCMSAVLNSLFFFSSPSYFIVFFLFLFYFFSFPMLTSGLCFSLEIPITLFRNPLLSAQQDVFHRACHDWYLLF